MPVRGVPRQDQGGVYRAGRAGCPLFCWGWASGLGGFGGILGTGVVILGAEKVLTGARPGR